MEDAEIVALYWKRDEQAIGETEKKYGAYCRAIAGRILPDAEDARECVNDTWLGAWNSIPPHRPESLSAYLGKLARRISLNRRRDSGRDKRGGGEAALALEELAELLPGGRDTEAAVEERELTAALARFLARLPRAERDAFVCRYWHFCPVAEIGGRFGWTESRVKVMLFRTRNKLRDYLQKEGFL